MWGKPTAWHNPKNPGTAAENPKEGMADVEGAGGEGSMDRNREAKPEPTLLTYSVAAVALARRLLQYSWIPWVVKVLRLVAYTVVLLPALLQVLFFYYTSSRVIRGVQYAHNSRNYLDVYLPPSLANHSAAQRSGTNSFRPVIVFVTGGCAIHF